MRCIESQVVDVSLSPIVDTLFDTLTVDNAPPDGAQPDAIALGKRLPEGL